MGWGVNPPLRPHHAAASCPSPPASCSWAEFGSPAANPQVCAADCCVGPLAQQLSCAQARAPCSHSARVQGAPQQQAQCVWAAVLRRCSGVRWWRGQRAQATTPITMNVTTM